MDLVHLIMSEAAEDAKAAYEANKDKPPSFRMSRAGLPLLQLVLEDFIIPKLPKLTTENPAPLKRQEKTQMAIGLGHLWSKACAKTLQQEYPDYSLSSEVPLVYRGIIGSCDHLLVSEKDKRVLVVECKSLGVKTLKEAKEQKLLVNNWGYFSQLCLYMASVRELYPDYQINGEWRVWCKPTEKSFSHRVQWGESIQETVDKAELRSDRYFEALNYLNAKDASGLVRGLVDCLKDDPLPEKTSFYGNLSASCGLHFSPWCSAIVDEDGLVYKNIKSRLTTLVRVALGLEDEKQALKLLTTRVN